MLKELVKGQFLQLSNAVRSKVINEIVNWNPIRTDNIDNKLDVLAYSIKAVEMYGHLMAFDSAIEDQEVTGAQVMSVEDNCSF